MPGYKVGDKLFSNVYAAFAWAAHHDPHRHPEFLIYDDVFSRCNWTKEPAQTWQELLRIRATLLRQKYDRLILAFSGGTDSMTCYLVFQELRIHIDEIIVTYSDDSIGNAPKETVDWLIRNHHDTSTAIKTWYRQDATAMSQYANKDWLHQDRGELRRFELTVPGPEIQRYLEEKYSNTRWALITGHEKPHIVYHDQQWCATHLDSVYHAIFGWPNLEMFFVSPDLPELHIKQHYLLLKQILNGCYVIKEGWSSCKELGKKSAADYNWLAQSCGRSTDAIPGSSFNQKQYNQQTKIKDVDLLLNRKLTQSQLIEPLLKARLQAGDPIAQNYVNGWCEMQQDTTLIDYLAKHGFLTHPDQMIGNYNQIWSKFFPLGSPT